MKKGKKKQQGLGLKRMSVYIYDAQLRHIDEICARRGIIRRIAFFEAFQSYIAQNLKGGNNE